MTSRDVALTWSAIYKGLKEEFPEDRYHWNEKDLHHIVTELTIATIRSSK
jgi:hypothetical protein